MGFDLSDRHQQRSLPAPARFVVPDPIRLLSGDMWMLRLALGCSRSSPPSCLRVGPRQLPLASGPPQRQQPAAAAGIRRSEAHTAVRHTQTTCTRWAHCSTSPRDALAPTTTTSAAKGGAPAAAATAAGDRSAPAATANSSTSRERRVERRTKRREKQQPATKSTATQQQEPAFPSLVQWPTTARDQEYRTSPATTASSSAAAGARVGSNRVKFPGFSSEWKNLLRPALQATGEARRSAARTIMQQLQREQIHHLDVDELQHLLTLLYLLERCPDVIDYQAVETIKRDEKILVEETFMKASTFADATRAASIHVAKDAAPVPSWGSTSPAYTISETDQLAQMLTRIIRETGAIMDQEKASGAPWNSSTEEAKPFAEAAKSRRAAFLQRLLLAMRRSGIMDFFAFSSSSNSIGFHARRTVSHRESVYVTTAPQRMFRMPFDGPEQRMSEILIQSSFTPIVLEDLLMVMEKHLDLFILASRVDGQPYVYEEDNGDIKFGDSDQLVRSAATSLPSATPATTTATVDDNAADGDSTGSCARSKPPPQDVPLPPATYTNSFHKDGKPTKFMDGTISNIVQLMSLLHSFRYLTLAKDLFRALRMLLTLDTRGLRQWRGACKSDPDKSATMLAMAMAARYHPALYVLRLPRRITPEEGELLDAGNALQSSVQTMCTVDQLLMRASVPDLIHILQLVAFHRKSALGLSPFQRTLRSVLWLRFGARTMSMHSSLDREALVKRSSQMQLTLAQVAKIMECYRKLDLAGMELEDLIRIAAEQAKVPTLDEWSSGLSEEARTAFFRRMLMLDPTLTPIFPAMGYPDPLHATVHIGARNLLQSSLPNAFQPRSPFDCLVLAFTSYANCSLPPQQALRLMSAPTPIWKPLWHWLRDEKRRAPLQVARAVAEIYIHLFENPAALKAHVSVSDHQHRFLPDVATFAHALILLDAENYDWARRFMSSMITWFESEHEIRLSLRSTSKYLFTRGCPVPVVHHSLICHRLHQVSLALFARSHRIRRTTGALLDDHFTTAEEDAAAREEPNLNFSSPYRELFKGASGNRNTRVSNFQVLVYRLLADPHGPFAFRQRVLARNFEFHPGDSLLIGDGQQRAQEERKEAMQHSALLDDPTMASTAAGGQPRVRPVDFFIEHKTVLGYDLDAAIFEEIEIENREEEEMDSKPLDSLRSLPAVRAALDSRPQSEARLDLPARPKTRLLSVAIEIDGPMHFRVGSREVLNASSMLRKKQLAQFGWHVVSISVEQWNELATDEARARWIAGMMPSQLLKRERRRRARSGEEEPAKKTQLGGSNTLKVSNRGSADSHRTKRLIAPNHQVRSPWPDRADSQSRSESAVAKPTDA